MKNLDSKNILSRKSVAIVTFHSWINGNLNYGATLQAYALCKAIGKLGHSVELIDYIPETIGARSRLKNTYRRLFRLIISRRVPRGKRIGFEKFIRGHCSLGKHRYGSFDALDQNPPDADVYISGSDQIWNTKIFHGALFPAFFLGFGSQSKKRVSYASSFGTHSPDIRLKDEIAGYLKQFAAISVRERSGEEVIKTLLGSDAAVTSVLDPTLLLQEYGEVSVHMDTKGMLLAYLFGPTQDDIVLLRQTASRMSLEPGLIWDKRMPRFKGIKLVECDSPSQWLGAMRNAEAVLTNSFHGTAFSIIFQHPFVSLLAGETGVANRNTRVLDLAEKLGVEGYLTVKRDVETWVGILENPTQWDNVNRNLSNERNASLKFLKDAIETNNI